MFTVRAGRVAPSRVSVDDVLCSRVLRTCSERARLSTRRDTTRRFREPSTRHDDATAQRRTRNAERAAIECECECEEECTSLEKLASRALDVDSACECDVPLPLIRASASIVWRCRVPCALSRLTLKSPLESSNVRRANDALVRPRRALSVYTPDEATPNALCSLVVPSLFFLSFSFRE